MVRRFVRLAAAVLLAVGLMFAAPAAGVSAKSKKTEKSSSKSGKKSSKSSKKDAKRDKRAAKKDKKEKSGTKEKAGKKSKKSERVAKSSSRSSDRSATRRGKNEDDEEQPTRARRTTTGSSDVAKRTVDGFDENDDGSGDEIEEPAGPKPANRVVADISPTRVMQIQGALISKGFLAGPPNGVYDQPTFQAMQAFQTRNGWNPVGVPTADSLKALGVPKNSGRGYMTPGRVVEATAPAPQ